MKGFYMNSLLTCARFEVIKSTDNYKNKLLGQRPSCFVTSLLQGKHCSWRGKLCLGKTSSNNNVSSICHERTIPEVPRHEAPS